MGSRAVKRYSAVMKIRAACRSFALIFLFASPAPAAETGRDDRGARVELAYLRLREKKWKESVALLGALLDEEPGDKRLRMELGYARYALGDPAAANDEFTLVAREPGEFQPQALEALKNIASEASQELRSDAYLDGAYDDLRRGDKAKARDKFQMALRANPGRTSIAKQLGYMSIAEGDMAGAAENFKGVRRLEPQDYKTALELGYIYDSLHDEAGAEKSFAAALPSRDPKIHAAAQEALESVRGRTDRLYLDVDAAGCVASRFANRIMSLDARAGWKLKPAGPLSAYLAARYTQDSRSRSGEAPEIYSDDAASLAPGLRLQPKGWNASLSAEWGGTVNLLRTRDHPDKTQTDGRVVLADYHQWQGLRRLFAEAGASVSYYSRYRDNVIGYLQLRGGVKILDDGASRVSLYAPLYALKDSNRDFYNNLVELGVGGEYQPSVKLNLKLRAEYLRGIYAGVQGRDPNPYGSHYDEVRVQLVYSGHFTRRPKPAAFEPTRRRRFNW